MINQLAPRSTGGFGSAVASQEMASQMSATPKVAVQQDNVVRIAGKWDMFPIPPAMTKVVTSATGAGAEAKTSYFGNEDAFNATATNNGSGAASIVNTYGDGFSGKSYNRLFAQPSINSTGLMCYGFTLQYVVTNGGAQDPSGITTANPTLLTANGTGSNMIPRGIVLSSGARNTQYLTGVMTVAYNFVMNSITQLSYNIPVGDSVTLTVLTNPI